MSDKRKREPCLVSARATQCMQFSVITGHKTMHINAHGACLTTECRPNGKICSKGMHPLTEWPRDTLGVSQTRIMYIFMHIVFLHQT
jgi:hypothetical protein